VLVVVNAVIGGGRNLAARLLDWPGPLAESRAVVVPRGAAAGLADALAEAGVVRDARLFRLALLIERGDRLHAGEFAFPAHASLRQVIETLRHGKPVAHHVTIPEGLTSREIAALLARAPALVGDALAPAEGSILPATYDYSWGTPRAALLQRAQAAMRGALAAAWAGRTPGLPLANPEQAVILASIVEHETAKLAERPLVAAVFLNRLRQGMRLQADATVVYAASGGAGALDRKLSKADLALDDPYNTYRINGLPPGPIDSPGLAALQAVLHPAPSDALYFVADGRGGHAFARTLDEHNHNVAHWRAVDGP
jgi:UPF0755 protein